MGESTRVGKNDFPMPYHTVCAPSSIFPEGPEAWPPIYTSESRSAFVNHSRPVSAAQSYRGARQPSATQVVMPASPLMTQLQCLQERLLRLQKQLDGNSAIKS